MEQRLRTWFTRRGLALARAGKAPRALDVLSGAIHYWRLEPRNWPRCLAAMKRLGLTIAETYAPWSVHERAPGDHDWTGARDLGAFLDRVADAGMYAIVRPGPHVNAELTLFGFPERVLRAPEVQARTARDTPVWLPVPPRMFPAPSYASPVFEREVATWLAAAAEVIAPRLWPDGPVIALGVDNEAQMFFRLGAFDHDYSDGALAWWAEYSGGLEPPRAYAADDAARCAMWVQFKEEYVARSLAWLARVFDRVGLRGVARFHNLPPSEPALVNAPEVARALGDGGLAALDFYHRARDCDAYRRRALYLVGSCRPLPFAAEVGAGGPPWLAPMSPADQRSVTLGLLSAGVRGLNLFMAVDRERWYGAPIAADGADRPIAAWYRRLLAVLAEVGWTSLARRTPVAVIVSRADARHAIASSVADPVSPVVAELLGLGPAGADELAGDADAAEHRRWLARVQRALDLAQVPYHLVDEGCPAEVLSGYRTVVMPTLDRVDRAAWRRLHALPRGADEVVVVVGPGRPTRDEHGRPLAADAALPARAGLIRAESAADIDGLADDLAGLAGDADETWTTGQGDVDCSLFETEGGEPRVLFVGNRRGDPVVADVLVPARATLTCPFSGEALAPDDGGAVDVTLAAYEVRMFVVS